VTDTTPYDSTDDATTDSGEFVVFRVVDDAEFEAAIAWMGINQPQNYWDRSNLDQAWNWLNLFQSSATLTTKSVSATELVTVTLDDETQDLNAETGEYLIQLTGAQLKAGSLVVTPNYGADGTDANGMPLVSIGFEGGRAERTVYSFSNAANGTDWWRRGETLQVTSANFNGQQAWEYATDNGGTVTYLNNNYADPVVNITQREFSLKINGLDMDGNGMVNSDDVREITFRANPWASDQYTVVNGLANTLSLAPWGYDLMTYSEASYDYRNHGIDQDEYNTLAALQNFVRFSGDNGRLVVDYLNPGNRDAKTLAFSEVVMKAGTGKDQDGVDVVSSELYVTNGTKNFFAVSSTSKLTAGDKLKFTITGSSSQSVSFVADITDQLARDNTDPIKLLEAAMKAGLATAIGTTQKQLNFTGTSVKAINDISQTPAKDAVSVTLANRAFKISVETVSEAGTLVVQQSSKDGAGGNVKAVVQAVQYNAAPDVAYSTSVQDLEGSFGAHVVNLASLSVIDSSANLQVTLSPTRGAHAGFFQFIDSSLFGDFLDTGNLKVQYMDPATNKLVDAKDKLPQGVGKLVITASAMEFVVGEQTITYKASDIVNLVLSGITFQLNRGLYSTEDDFATSFDLAINDDFKAASNKVLDGTFATGGDRMYGASVVHSTLDDVTGDKRVDANDAVVKVSTLRQLATIDNLDDLDPGLHLTDNSTDASQGINNEISASKVFSITNKTLLHGFNTGLANMMVDQGLTSISSIFLHADDDLQYSMLDYAKAGFLTLYNETSNAFSTSVAEANQLTSLGIGVVGDVEISFGSEKAQTLLAPLRSVQSLAAWAPADEVDKVADYVLKDFGAGDKLDLKTLLKIESKNLVLADETDALAAYTAASTTSTDYSTHSLYASFDAETDTVDYYYVGWDQTANEAATKAHFKVELTGIDLTESTSLETLKTYLL